MTKLAKRKSVLTVLDEELKTQGFVGSTDVPKLVFLSLYTRFFEDPVALVIKGPTSSGKSFSIKSGLEFIPPDAYVSMSGMTPKALVYMRDIDLKHKFLVIGERAGLDKKDGQVFLRQLLTEKQIDYHYVSRQNGTPVTQVVKVEGPTGLLMSTTDEVLHPEDESRVISIKVKGSQQKVREALLRQANELGGKAKKKLNTEPWFELHEFVSSNRLEVLIPYRRHLVDYLPGHDRVQRDFPKLMALIRAHALLHQETRETGPRGVVLATLADYEAVYPLVAPALAQGIEDEVPPFIRQMVEAVERHQAGGNGQASTKKLIGVSQSQLAHHLGRNQTVVGRHLEQAKEMGYLKNEGPVGKGISARLVLGDTKLPTGKVLPDPKELAA